MGPCDDQHGLRPGGRQLTLTLTLSLTLTLTNPQGWGHATINTGFALGIGNLYCDPLFANVTANSLCHTVGSGSTSMRQHTAQRRVNIRALLQRELGGSFPADGQFDWPEDRTAGTRRPQRPTPSRHQPVSPHPSGGPGPYPLDGRGMRGRGSMDGRGMRGRGSVDGRGMRGRGSIQDGRGSLNNLGSDWRDAPWRDAEWRDRMRGTRGRASMVRDGRGMRGRDRRNRRHLAEAGTASRGTASRGTASRSTASRGTPRGRGMPPGGMMMRIVPVTPTKDCAAGAVDYRPVAFVHINKAGGTWMRDVLFKYANHQMLERSTPQVSR